MAGVGIAGVDITGGGDVATAGGFVGMDDGGDVADGIGRRSTGGGEVFGTV